VGSPGRRHEPLGRAPDDVGSARPVTRDAGSGVYDYQWAFDGRHILYLKDKDGDENWHIFVTDLEGSPPRDITPYAGARCTILKLSERRPAEVLVGMNDRDPSLSDAWAVDIKSGERSLVVRNEGFVGYEFDLDFTPRLAVRLLPRTVRRTFSWPPRMETGNPGIAILTLIP
jgi:Tol biopolymer transport system component